MSGGAVRAILPMLAWRCAGGGTQAIALGDACLLHCRRGGLIHGQPVTELLHNVWPLVVMGVVLIPLGVYVFGVAERYAKRTGKAIEQG